MRNEDEYLEFVNDCYYGSSELSLIWSNLPCEWNNFEEHRDAFFYVLERLLKEGRIKLANNALVLARKRGEPWDDEKYLAKGMIEEQLELFRAAWPESEAATGYEDFDWWFFDDACPYCPVWQPA